MLPNCGYDFIPTSSLWLTLLRYQSAFTSRNKNPTTHHRLQEHAAHHYLLHLSTSLSPTLTLLSAITRKFPPIFDCVLPSTTSYLSLHSFLNSRLILPSPPHTSPSFLCNGAAAAGEEEAAEASIAVQNYDWGLPASASRVASLHALNAGASVDPRKAHAELWMGTHDSGPCYLNNNNNRSEKNNGAAALTTLKSWLRQNPGVLGERVLDHWGCHLPFLFKVLWVGKALSIQAHPDKEQARSLHKRLPNIYKDANHKPEMVLAITKFEALCGFVSLEELQDVVANVPEVAQLIGSANKDQVLHFNVKDGQEKFKPVLAEAFTQLMSADKDVVAEAASKLKRRLQSEFQVREPTEKERLVLRLEEQYPGDVGVVSAFFLNYVRLKPGEALCLGANEPHAYLSGECVECMATSDTVVRAGRTPKLRDVSTLCSMLTYKQGYPEILKGISVNPYTKRYPQPFDEFEVDHCALPQGAL